MNIKARDGEFNRIGGCAVDHTVALHSSFALEALRFPSAQACWLRRLQHPRSLAHTDTSLVQTSETTQESNVTVPTTETEVVQTRAAMCVQARVCVQWGRLAYRNRVVTGCDRYTFVDRVAVHKIDDRP